MVQGQTPGVAHTRIPDPEATIPHDAIRDELNRVLSGHEFRSSKRSQEFLRFVVDNTLNGHSDILKERTIGIEVFGRSVTYDPSEDATVRVKAGEVRKRLGLYYAGEGAHNPLRIDLPGGTYVPEFRRSDAPVPEEHRAEESVAEGLSEERFLRHPLWIAAAAVMALIAGGACWLVLRGKPAPTTLDQFWSPVFQANTPLSLCAAFVPVYWPDRAPTPQQPLRPEDFTLLNDQFVGGGDLIAVSRLSAMLTRKQRPYYVRIGSETSFHDLESAPAILVGYSYTRWKEISSEMRFFIDGSRRPIGITDGGVATKWTLPNLPADRHTTEDYAIVSRVFHPDTHKMLVEIAGITQYGTDAASDLVTNTDLLTEALRSAPSDWQKKNLQMVLHVKVVSGAPSSPKVVATYFW